MIAHTLDTLPATQVTATAARVQTADAGAARALYHQTASDWAPREVPGVDGLCFVRRGSGGWKGVITVCEGTAMSLAQRQVAVATTRGADVRPVRISAVTAGDGNLASVAEAPAPVSAWRRAAALGLLALGMVLGIKSGSMWLEGFRK